MLRHGKNEEIKQLKPTRDAPRYNELCDLYIPTCIFRVYKSRKQQWVGCGCGARLEIIDFVRGTLRKGWSSIAWNDNIKMDLSNSVVKKRT